jgi:four helix bundle protein
MARTRHYRDLTARQKAMDLARQLYASTEDFPNSETFGLRMQMRPSAVSVASHSAVGHGRLADTEARRALGAARGSLNELQTQTELAPSLGFLKSEAAESVLNLSIEVAKLTNGLIGSLEP